MVSLNRDSNGGLLDIVVERERTRHVRGIFGIGASVTYLAASENLTEVKVLKFEGLKLARSFGSYLDHASIEFTPLTDDIDYSGRTMTRRR